MNSLSGEVIDVRSADELSLVKVKCGQVIFTSLVIMDPSNRSFLLAGKKANVHFKETEVIIAKPGPLEISVQNRIPCKIKKMEEGKILSQLSLTFEGMEIISIITTTAVKQLNLSTDTEVVALIKTNEVTISYRD